MPPRLLFISISSRDSENQNKIPDATTIYRGIGPADFSIIRRKKVTLAFLLPLRAWMPANAPKTLCKTIYMTMMSTPRRAADGKD